MRRILTILVFACIAGWLVAPENASAQGLDPRMATTYTPPPVSPFLNLGVNQDGSSNYQSLVRPMLEEREGLVQQSAKLQQLQKRLRDAQAAPEQADHDPKGRPVRMYYSHYYTGLRSGVPRPYDR